MILFDLFLKCINWSYYNYYGYMHNGSYNIYKELMENLHYHGDI